MYINVKAKPYLAGVLTDSDRGWQIKLKDAVGVVAGYHGDGCLATTGVDGSPSRDGGQHQGVGGP